MIAQLRKDIQAKITLGIFKKKTLIGACEVKEPNSALKKVLFVDVVLMDDAQAQHRFGHRCGLKIFVGRRVGVKNIAVVLAIKVERIAIELTLVETNLKRWSEHMLLIQGNRIASAQLDLIGLKLAIANLVVKIIEPKTPLFPFGVGGKCGGLKWDRDTAPLRAVIGGQAEVFFEIAGTCRVLKDWVIVELCPMDVLGEHGCCH